LRGGNG